jgi:hypothetical protein
MLATRNLRLAAILVGLAAIALTSLRPTSRLHAAAGPSGTEIYSFEGGVSRPLREIAEPSRGAEGIRIRPLGLLPFPSGTSSGPQQILDFAGIGAGDYGYSPSELPPWPNGAVGATQYVQGVSKSFAVFDRTTGALVFGPASTDIFWTNLSPDCANNSQGSALFRYDRAADRWVVVQSSSITQPFSGPLHCIAVSRTPDVLGPYKSAAYAFSSEQTWVATNLGVWPDAYYLTMDHFAAFPHYGARVCALDRPGMLGPMALPLISCQFLDENTREMLPADLDGATPPPPASPNYLLSLGTNSLRLWKFGPLVAGTAPLVGPTSIPVTAYANACGTGGSCIPQPGTTQTLDSVGNRLMPRLAYRNFGDHESLVVNHSVDAGGGVAGVRWYEIRSPGTTPTVFQQGTHAPTADHRWMGSVAMDRGGNIALGYSVSSATVSPSMRYAGREAGDPPGTLGAEQSLIAGTGSQLSDSAWGRWSSLALDPTDDCTFYYTNEYLKTSGALNWSTRIGSFRFPSCGATRLYTIAPCRLVDTRGPAGPTGGPALAAGATRIFPMSGACAIPADATSISLNLTAVNPVALGYLTLYAGDAPTPPPVSTLNFSAGRTRGSNTIVALPLGGGGTIQVRNGSAGAVDVVLDVTGYFK